MQPVVAQFRELVGIEEEKHEYKKHKSRNF